VSASGQAIVVRSPDHSAAHALAETNASVRDEAPDDRLNKMVAAKTALFPSARLDHVTPREGGAVQEAVGAASYTRSGNRTNVVTIRLFGSI
jgi:hypothetical protein